MVDSASVVVESNVVHGNGTCPLPELPPATSSGRAYGTVTVIVLFFCFAVLFIGLIVFVFCKAGDNVPEYAELQEDREIQDEDDVDVLSD
jgi:hypothetical protein